MKNFADRLIEAIEKKKSPVCVGLDPRLERIPEFIREDARKEHAKDGYSAAAAALFKFNKGIIDSVADIVPIVKPQIAFYEMYGAAGVLAFQETVKYALKHNLLVLADVKRNDIGSTASAYADGFLGELDPYDEKRSIFNPDAITVTPYLGWDGIKPFVKQAGKHGRGLFVLVKTSNPSSGDLQDLELKDGGTVYEVIGQLVSSWGADLVGEKGYSSVGAVVGATYPAQAKILRELMPKTIFLVPGYGAQGGGAEDVKPCFNKDGLGALVNASRSIHFAWEESDRYTEKDFGDAARAAAVKMTEEIMGVL